MHEVIQQGSESNSVFQKLFKSVYKGCNKVIIHSEHGKEMLDRVGYRGEMFEIPHFRYCEDSSYNIDSIKEDVKSAFLDTKTNLLFFGNITYNKGIDILIDFYRKLSPNIKDKLHLVIAGNSIDGKLEGIDIKQNEGISVINRHIADDEMKYLFLKSSFVLLPYRITYQSGVLEMAFNYRKPVIVSDIPYFKSVISEYNSFGRVMNFNSNSAEVELSEILQCDKALFFSAIELDHYYNQKIVNKFHDWILSMIR